MRKVETSGQLKLAFDSVPEMSRFIRDTAQTWPSNDSQDTPQRESWDLNCGFNKASDYAANGWLEGAEQAGKAMRILPLRSAAPDTRTDFYGHLPHVPRYCAGAPDSMIRHARDATAGSGKVITLYVPVSGRSGIPASALSNLGLAIAQYVNQLEADGHRVELHGALCAEYPGTIGTITWRIKSADQPLDIAVLSFAIGHPAMLRRILFAVLERSDMPYTIGYGRPYSMTLDNALEPAPGSYIVNGAKVADSVATTPEKALAYVTRQLDKMLDTSDAEGVE